MIGSVTNSYAETVAFLQHLEEHSTTRALALDLCELLMMRGQSAALRVEVLAPRRIAS
jgi:hypothetical protein